MKKIICSLILFITINTVFSQTGWYWQNPLPQGNNLNDIFFIDETHGWAVGDYGTVLYTSDRGNSWQRQKSFTDKSLYAAFFHSATDGWAVGPYGVIRYWNGDRWIAQESAFTGHLYDVHFIDSLQGWIVGQNQTVLHTDNGGTSWDILTTGGPEHYFSVHFINENAGYLAGAANFNGVIKRTNDGGNSWDIEIVPANRMNAITFGTENSGWAVGDNGAIFHKEGTEASWVIQSCGSNKHFRSVSAASGNQVWITGSEGFIGHSVNGGDSWTIANSGTELDLESVFLVSGQKGWAAGKAGAMIRTGDGGETWHSINSKGPQGTLADICFMYPELGIAVGGDGIICSTLDQGETWLMDTSGTENHLYAVDIARHYISYDRAIAVGKFGAILRKWWEPDMLYEDWEEKEYMHNEDLNGIDVRGRNMWAAGQFGSVAFSANSGNSWERQHMDMSYHLNDIHFPTSNNGWAVGLFGSILHTNNKGEEWIKQNSPVNANFNSVHFSDYQTGWAVGSPGIIIHTKDKGRNWVEQNSGTDKLLTHVFFTDCNNGWIVGDQGLILHTNNGGESWGIQKSGTSNILLSVWFADPLNGWICGENGTILHTKDGGGTTYQEIGLRHDLGIPINDFEILSDTLEIFIPEDKKATHEEYKLIAVELVLDTIYHTSVGDLELILSHNSVRDTVLFHSGGKNANFFNLNLSDVSTIPVDSGAAPFSGVFMPFKPLSAFAGMDPEGKWILEIKDGIENNTGTLNAWSLILYMGKDDIISGIKPKQPPKTYDYRLRNYPNPFSGQTTISYYLPEPSDMVISVYNLYGHQVARLFKGSQISGSHEIQWSPEGLESGIYIVMIQGNSFCRTAKMMYFKEALRH